MPTLLVIRIPAIRQRINILKRYALDKVTHLTIPGEHDLTFLKSEFTLHISAIKVLPAPFGPITAHCCPSSILQFTGAVNRNSGKRVTIFLISTTIIPSFSIFFLNKPDKDT